MTRDDLHETATPPQWMRQPRGLSSMNTLVAEKRTSRYVVRRFEKNSTGLGLLSDKNFPLCSLWFHVYPAFFGLVAQLPFWHGNCTAY